MNPAHPLHVTRRHFFRECGVGLGTMALSSLLGSKLFAGGSTFKTAMAPRPPHFAPRAKNVIFLQMMGAPSQLDLYEHKPKLKELHGQKISASMMEGRRFAFIKNIPTYRGSIFNFKQHGQSGAYVSELLPNIAEIVDEVCFVRSIHTDQFNHAPAQIFMNTGSGVLGRPSMGSWLTYGIGSENHDLPGFVVLAPGDQPDGGKSCWSNGFLPSEYQGVELRTQGDPVLFVNNPGGVTSKDRRDTLDTLKALNQIRLKDVNDPEIAARIEAYELAYRMQTSVPELMDISQEPEHIHKLYGTEPGKTSFANACLLARRLVERGVRFVQVSFRGDRNLGFWDSHGDRLATSTEEGLPFVCKMADQASAALIKDLKQRGMLKDTLVIWGGEFGRTPMDGGISAGRYTGRDHWPDAATMWMAGGGVKQGASVGATDELGFSITEDPVHIHDLHATILHLLGLDHEKLTYKFQGRDFRLTDVHGKIIQKIFA